VKKINITCQPNTLNNLINTFEKSVLLTRILASYEHSLSSINYNQEYAKESKEYEEYIDISLCVYLDNQPVIFIPLYLKDNQASFFGQPSQLFEIDLLSDERLYIYARVAKYLKNIIQRLNINSLLVKEHRFFLTFFTTNIIDILPITTMSVDLSISTSMLKTNLRKSYKSLVNWGKKKLTCVTLQQGDCSKDKFNDFKDFHCAVAGKKTRSDFSWEIQFTMVTLGEAIVNLYYLDDVLVAGNLILLGKENAFYGVGVYNRNLMESDKLPLSHWPLLDSIYKCKVLGLSRFDLGCYDSDVNHNKLKQISDFKKGFATDMEINNNLKISFSVGTCK
jgi:hypothetical protein